MQAPDSIRPPEGSGTRAPIERRADEPDPSPIARARDTDEPGPTSIAAVRGAVTVPENSAGAIRAATARLLLALLEANRLTVERIVSAVFTATPDLDADFPAHAARILGWNDVPLLGARELGVPGALPRVVRVLLTVSGVPLGRRLVPVYLEGAAALRPDLAHAAESKADDARVVRRVALVGLGQIGGSIGLALGRVGGWRRVGFDADAAVIARALEAHAIDEAADSPAAACANADLAVIATPNDTIADLVSDLAAALPAGATLLDTGSARAGVTEALERAAALGVRVVGGHPLAGNEGRGIAAARSDLFQGAGFAVLPIGEVPAIVLDLIADLGARPVTVAPDDHDRALARTSHLPYLVACAIESRGRDDAERGLSGPGFRDMTRLARVDPRVALAYCRINAREIAAAWAELRGELDRRVAELGRDAAAAMS
jgi:monofunctional chorismate mutase